MPTLTKVKREVKWRLKGCSHCGGDLNLVEVEVAKIYRYSEWQCLQCGRSYGN